MARNFQDNAGRMPQEAQRAEAEAEERAKAEKEAREREEG